MKRVIAFDHETPARNQKRFDLLTQAVLIGGSPGGQGTRGGIEVLRREARLLDGLESVSVHNPDAAQTLPVELQRTVTVDATLVLEQPDFDLLKKRVEETVWLPPAARAAVECFDWLSAAPEAKEA